MIEIMNGDMFKSNTEALVNPVNCVGVMGKGLALKFKKIFPDNFLNYKKICNNHELKIGNVLLYITTSDKPKYIINFPTKIDWRNMSDISYIRSGLKALVDVLIKHKIKSVAIPALGCGLGGLRWSEVKEEIEKAFLDIDIDIKLYKPRLKH